MKLKGIMLAVQAELGEGVEALAYVDRNWGQLNAETPAVRYPCALLDVAEVGYSHMSGRGSRRCEGTLTVTVVDQRTVSSGLGSPDRERSYGALGLAEAVAGRLDGWAVEVSTMSPLLLTGLRHLETASTDYEAFEVSFRLVWGD